MNSRFRRGPRGRRAAPAESQPARIARRACLRAARIARIPHPAEDLPVWLASARAMIALISNDAKEAAAQFRFAHDRASTLPDFDETARLTLKQRLAFCYIRLGDGATAERLFRELITAFTRTNGPDSPNVLRVRLNLAQAFMIQAKHKEAIEETTAIYPMYVARLGEDHELSMQVLSTRAESEARWSFGTTRSATIRKSGNWP
jgi:eukaryotic-like serine/threonine-protein kinase